MEGARQKNLVPPICNEGTRIVGAGVHDPIRCYTRGATLIVTICSQASFVQHCIRNDSDHFFSGSVTTWEPLTCPTCHLLHFVCADTTSE